ncbi:MAG: aspartate aminotransferase family protein [Clostridia bacterium]|nr:aspartate aminotransferase family protein [Clostridia bacterium]
MTFEELKAIDDAHVMHTYGRNQIAVNYGKGATVYDLSGKAFIDMTSGIGVNCLGYGNEKWAKAIADQAMKLGHISNLYYTEPCAKLADELCKRTGMERVFFGNSGAEGNEGIIKLARKYSFDKYGEGRSTIITLKNSFHGRTITTLKATGQDHFHEFFFPFTEGFKYAPANDLEALKAMADDSVCAVMMELVQGEGGVFTLDEEYVKAVRALCDEKDMLLLVDEVQTGVGRTGSLFAFQGFDILPDAVSFAKGIAGGLPMGGFMASKKVSDVLGPGTHGSTFGGNPVASAAALAVLEQIDDKLLAEVNEKGAYIKNKVMEMNSPNVVEVRGKGLMLGIQLDGLVNKDIAAALQSKGVLVLTAGNNVVRLLPPLVISYEEIDKALEVLASVISE